MTHLRYDVPTGSAHLVEVAELTLPGLLPGFPGAGLRTTHRGMGVGGTPRLLAVRQVGGVAMARMVVMPHVDAFPVVHTPSGDEALDHDAQHNGDGPGGDQESAVTGRRRGMRSHAEDLGPQKEYSIKGCSRENGILDTYPIDCFQAVHEEINGSNDHGCAHDTGGENGHVFDAAKGQHGADDSSPHHSHVNLTVLDRI